MTPPTSLASLVLLAGFGIAAGIAVLYHYFNNDAEEQFHEYHRNRRRRRSPSPSPAPLPSSSPTPERRRLRAISPPRESQNLPGTPTPPREAHNTTDGDASVSNGTNRASRHPEEILSCAICAEQMNTCLRRIILECQHIFHDECYTIWRHAVVRFNPHARLCPSC